MGRWVMADASRVGRMVALSALRVQGRQAPLRLVGADVGPARRQRRALVARRRARFGLLVRVLLAAGVALLVGVGVQP